MSQNKEYEILNRKYERTVLRQNKKGEVEYLSFPGLEQTGLVNHLFSTRKGGVSEGIFSTMNLSYTRGDEKPNVDENFRRIAGVFGSLPERIVCSDQTHTTNVRLVTEKDAGKGVMREKDYKDVDGLITDVPGLILATFYADCVPLFFVDTEKRAIGLSHSGWKGTVHRMGEVTLKAMRENFGTRPEMVKAAIGPSICQDCYEVSSDVAEQFEKVFPLQIDKILKPGKEEGKYQLDLWQANKIILLDAGILPENLEVTDVCTCCNSDYLFSHRGNQGKRGNLGAFMELRKS
ncbi:MAG: peptidoglycan editing factor PgeF [Suilimivivens sp.]